MWLASFVIQVSIPMGMSDSVVMGWGAEDCDGEAEDRVGVGFPYFIEPIYVNKIHIKRAI